MMSASSSSREDRQSIRDDYSRTPNSTHRAMDMASAYGSPSSACCGEHTSYLSATEDVEGFRDLEASSLSEASPLQRHGIKRACDLLRYPNSESRWRHADSSPVNNERASDNDRICSEQSTCRNSTSSFEISDGSAQQGWSRQRILFLVLFRLKSIFVLTIGGVFAATGAVFAKSAFDFSSQASTLYRGLPVLGLPVGIIKEYLIRLVFLCLMLTFNAFMVKFNFRALSVASSIAVSMMQFASNTVTSGIMGSLLFKERLGTKWVVGAGAIVLGVILISTSVSDATGEAKTSTLNSKLDRFPVEPEFVSKTEPTLSMETLSPERSPKDNSAS